MRNTSPDVEPNAKVHDPVCHMDIEITDAAGRSDYDGHTYYFCSPGCKVDFDADPDGMLKAEATYDHVQLHTEMMQGIAATAAAEAVASESPSPTSRAPATMAPASEKKPWWRFWG